MHCQNFLNMQGGFSNYNLLETCIQEAAFLENFKIAKVTPVFKIGAQQTMKTLGQYLFYPCP